jgi:restriction endonuclease S subunit
MNLSSMKRRLAEMARGAVGQANINAKELRSIKLPVPPLSLQKEFRRPRNRNPRHASRANGQSARS